MKQLKNKTQAIKNCKKQTRKINYKEAGITLVALVVTIIVDLISYDRNKKYRNLADSPIIDINL